MSYLWKKDSFDSEILDKKVAKIESVDPESTGDLIEDFTKHNIQYATFRVESDKSLLIRSLENKDFIKIDGILHFERELIDPGEGKKERIRTATRDDVEELKRLTTGLYSNNRIFNDPTIPVDKKNLFYNKWIENSVLGIVADEVLVWEEQGKILGYITLLKKGRVGLLGVSQEARGRGIGKNLLKEAFNIFKLWGNKKAIVETQTTNIPAIRLYESLGFKEVSSYLTLRWIND